jgi:hypothetical protein
VELTTLHQHACQPLSFPSVISYPLYYWLRGQCVYLFCEKLFLHWLKFKSCDPLLLYLFRLP